ncbi:MAG: RNA methyltransferase [candidate division KSB1 bacterium]|nr:RNA methyltransferase [candidate division KSB1 bacterium]MDZ7347090.1 RNA methyltransferase [candidate division KSB1 bacterium]
MSSGRKDAFSFPPLSLQRLKSIRALKQKKYRRETGSTLIEGVRLCEEALASGIEIQAVITTPEAHAYERVAELARKCAAGGLDVFTLPHDRYLLLSDEPSPVGLAMVIRLPAVQSWHGAEPLLLALDGLQDPGNLGSALRSAAWFGVERVWLSKGCVELSNPKVLRGAMGAAFRLAVEEEVDLMQRFAEAKKKGYCIWAAVPVYGEPLTKQRPTGKDLLLIGSEAHGVAAELVETAHRRFTIPKSGYGESLNAAVAASIALYHFTLMR